MSTEVWYKCNGCDRTLFLKDPINIVKIDLSRYISFSSGYVPKLTNIDIHFCNRCYSEILDNKIQYSTDGTFDEIIKKNMKLKDEIKKLNYALSEYKCNVAHLLSPLRGEE